MRAVLNNTARQQSYLDEFMVARVAVLHTRPFSEAVYKVNSKP